MSGTAPSLSQLRTCLKCFPSLSTNTMPVSGCRGSVCLPLNMAASMELGSRCVSVSTVVAYLLPPMLRRTGEEEEDSGGDSITAAAARPTRACERE